MSKTCLNCGYKRKETDDTPDYSCPACKIVYAKYEAKLNFITIDINSFSKDINKGFTDSELMKKYQITSLNTLIEVFNKVTTFKLTTPPNEEDLFLKIPERELKNPRTEKGGFRNNENIYSSIAKFFQNLKSFNLISATILLFLTLAFLFVINFQKEAVIPIETAQIKNYQYSSTTYSPKYRSNYDSGHNAPQKSYQYSRPTYKYDAEENTGVYDIFRDLGYSAKESNEAESKYQAFCVSYPDRCPR